MEKEYVKSKFADMHCLLQLSKQNMLQVWATLKQNSIHNIV